MCATAAICLFVCLGDIMTFSALTIMPLSVTIIGAAFAIVIFNHYFSTRRRPHEMVWGIAFLLFALAAACQASVDISGAWSPLLARTYYLAGAVLNVAFLGLGTMYLLFNRRVANIALALMLVFTVISVYVLATVPLNMQVLAGSHQADWKSVFKPSIGPSLLAGIGSGLGSVIVIAGALWSGWTFWRKRIMKHRMIGVFLLAAGTFIVAFGGTLKGLMNNDDYLYPTMAVGVVIMFVGYLETIRTVPATQSKVAQPAPESRPTA